MNNIIKTWLFVGVMAATVGAADKLKAPEKTVISAENFMFNPLKNIAVYEGDAFAAWRGNLFVGALVNNDVRRLTLAGNTVVAEEILFAELDQRIRDIRVSPDGLLYIITDGAQGQVVRVSPK